jgi:hypothetical protein
MALCYDNLKQLDKALQLYEESRQIREITVGKYKHTKKHTQINKQTNKQTKQKKVNYIRNTQVR